MMPADPVFEQQPQGLPFVNWERLPVPRTVSEISLTASKLLLKGTGLIIGITESTIISAAQATAEIYDGYDATGNLLAVMAAITNQSSAMTVPIPGIPFHNGLYVNVVTGRPTITITYVPLIETLP